MTTSPRTYTTLRDSIQSHVSAIDCRVATNAEIVPDEVAPNHLRTVVRGRLPAYEETSPLASAVHGLGLLLMTTMAVSGGVYAAQVWAGLQSPEPDGSLAMTVHFALANLVWVYLIAHAGLATIHHFGKSAPLGKMWRLRS